MNIRSTYRDSEKDQFEAEIVGNGEDMGEPAYVCLLLPQYRDQFQNGHETFKIRKRLVGEDGIYRLVKMKPVQLTLF